MSTSTSDRVCLRMPVPVGDVLDRLSILRIKCTRVTSEPARKNVDRELAAVERAWSEAGLPIPESLGWYGALLDVNRQLWDVEDQLRNLEREGQFDDEFVGLARSVYRLNDRRAAIKREVNVGLRSDLAEEKVHPRYGDG